MTASARPVGEINSSGTSEIETVAREVATFVLFFPFRGLDNLIGASSDLLASLDLALSEVLRLSRTWDARSREAPSQHDQGQHQLQAPPEESTTRTITTSAPYEEWDERWVRLVLFGSHD